MVDTLVEFERLFLMSRSLLLLHSVLMELLPEECFALYAFDRLTVVLPGEKLLLERRHVGLRVIRGGGFARLGSVVRSAEIPKVDCTALGAEISSEDFLALCLDLLFHHALLEVLEPLLRNEHIAGHQLCAPRFLLKPLRLQRIVCMLHVGRQANAWHIDLICGAINVDCFWMMNKYRRLVSRLHIFDGKSSRELDRPPLCLR